VVNNIPIIGTRSFHSAHNTTAVFSCGNLNRNEKEKPMVKKLSQKILKIILIISARLPPLTDILYFNGNFHELLLKKITPSYC